MSDQTRDYRQLFLNGTPLMDVRAPVEFGKGSFPAAENLPLLTDDERHQVGIRYKQAGQQAAIELGEQLVAGDEKTSRVDAWLAFTRRHPDGCLFCFRGGLRSRIVQDWLREAGVDYPRVAGGYKAMRRFLLESFQRDVQKTPIQLLSGRTGTGKTRLIEALSDAIDLEGLAHHRGSAFGRRPGGQPAQIDFENRLAIDLLRHCHRTTAPVILEDESRLIGRCHLPPILQEKMQDAARILVEEPLESRVQVTLEDYVLGPLAEYQRWYGDDQAQQRLGEELLAAMDRIKKRLGGARHAELRAVLEKALAEQAARGDVEHHREWIRALLSGYYDPMYDHMLKKRQGRILFRGRRAEVMDWLSQQAA